MTPKPPLLSGKKVIKALKKIGFIKKGSHIKLHNPATQITLIIPDHKEVDRWTLKGILNDAEIPVKNFIRMTE